MRRRDLLLTCLAVGITGPVAHRAGATELAAIHPACDAPAYRQFDFWIGLWDVRDGGITIAQSRIERGHDGCTLDEHYAQKDGYRGGSISFYDAVLRQWRQTWVDAVGSVGEFAGRFEQGAMRFAGETHTGDGRRVLRRLTLAPDAFDRVRQTSEASTDDGRTWRLHYDFTYIRHGASRSEP